jgi:acetyltransferase
MHIETIRGSGRRFVEVLKDTTKRKSVIILKSGRTSTGARAAASHTGSVAQENDLILDNILRQAGAIRAQNLEEFFEFAKVFEFLNPPNGNRTAIVNLSGGEGVIATDACEQNGLQIARLGKKTFEKLKEIFPPWEIPLNPLDFGVCMEFHMTEFITQFSKVFDCYLGSILEDENVDLMIMQIPSSALQKAVPLGFPSSAFSELTDGIVDIFLRMKEKGKPLALWRSSLDSMEEELVRKLEVNHIPVYLSSERAVKALAALYRYSIMQKGGK